MSMSDTRNQYEGLFLFPQSAASNLKEAADHVQSLLDRAEAEVLAFSKWDERRLAYEIAGNKRGVYFLTYFKADPQRMERLERDCNLSEQLLRFMCVRADTVPAEVIEAADGRDTLADEIRLRGEKEDKGRGGRERARVVDAATRAEEERKAAEAKKAEEGGAPAGGDGAPEGDAGKSGDAEAKTPAPAEATASE